MPGFLIGGERYQPTASTNSSRELANIHPHRKPDVLDDNNQTKLVEMRDTGNANVGRGLFAREALQTGRAVFVFDGKKIAYDHREPFSSAYLIMSIVVGRETPPGGGLHGPRFVWADPDDKAPLRYVNHRCKPNIGRSNKGYADPFQFVAIEDIEPGEQLTADYSLLETNPNWRMKCECGAENCRGEIRAIVHLPPEYLAEHWDNIIPCMQEWAVRESKDPRIQEVVQQFGWKHVQRHFVELFLKKGVDK